MKARSTTRSVNKITSRAPAPQASDRARDLYQALAAAPYEFDFFQALRRLECVNPHHPRIGQSLLPAADPIRLAQQPSLIFAPTAIADYEFGKKGRPARLLVYFLGLLGPNGPLPIHLSEYARERLHNFNDPTFARFLDIFHHRILSLFYRAWANAQPVVSFDRPEMDRFAIYVGSLFGLGKPSLQHRDALPDLAKLHYAGHLVSQTRHPSGLQAILSAFFNLPVKVQEFIGHWLLLPRDGHCHLGTRPETGTLGMSVIIGERVWDGQTKFRLVFGPMGLRDYQRLLPGGDSFKRLIAWVRNYVGDHLAWDLQLVLKKDEVPALQLGVVGQLGWTTWISGRPFVEDASDLVLDAMAHKSYKIQ